MFAALDPFPYDSWLVESFTFLLADAEQPEHHKADFQALHQSLLAFSTPSAACRAVEAGQSTEHIIRLSEPVLVPPSATSRQQLGLKRPAISKLTPAELIEVLGFTTEVRPLMRMSSGACQINFRNRSLVTLLMLASMMWPAYALSFEGEYRDEPGCISTAIH